MYPNLLECGGHLHLALVTKDLDDFWSNWIQIDVHLSFELKKTLVLFIFTHHENHIIHPSYIVQLLMTHS